MKNIVLVSGKAQNGKTTFANFTKEYLEEQGYKVAICPLAKHLKQYLIDYYGWDGVTKDEFYRTKMQELGTDIIRLKLGKPAFHVNRTIEDIEILSQDFDFFLVDDNRFRNELFGMLAKFPDNVFTVKVVRPDFESPLTEEQQQHLSEIDLDTVDNKLYDIVFHNCLDKESMRNNVRWIVDDCILEKY